MPALPSAIPVSFHYRVSATAIAIGKLAGTVMSTYVNRLLSLVILITIASPPTWVSTLLANIFLHLVLAKRLTSISRGNYQVIYHRRNGKRNVSNNDGMRETRS